VLPVVDPGGHETDTLLRGRLPGQGIGEAFFRANYDVAKDTISPFAFNAYEN
jgi:hypothetical protein